MKKIVLLGSLFGAVLFAEVVEVGGHEKDDKKQVIIDYGTNLMWQDSADAKSVERDWQGAIRYCEELSLAGYSDWRLPSKEELGNMYKLATKNMFRYTASDYYWSSTSHAVDPTSAWFVSFNSGVVHAYAKTYSNHVRCVRGHFGSFAKFSALYENILDETMANLPKPPVQAQLIKGEFEKQAEFEKRIEATKKANAIAIEKYKKEYQAYYPKAKKEAMQKSLEIYYGKPVITDLAYDADNEIFGAKLAFENNSELKHNIVIKMPPLAAQQFRADFEKITPIALFDFDGSNVSFRTVKFSHNKKEYLAMLTDKVIGGGAIQVAKLDANRPNMSNIATSISVSQGKNQTFDTSSLISTNDLDDLLAKAPNAKIDPKKWLFVVGLENYKYTDAIVYAKRSAQMFAKVAQKTLGVPRQNSYELIDEGATAAEIKNKMKMMLRNVKAGDTIYFYYNGHGVPAVNKQNEAFILSADMMPDFVGDEPAFMMKQIYKELSDSKASRIVAVIDSCFSGSTDGKSIHKGVAAGVLKPKSIDFDKTKMVVLTAGRDTQYSNAYIQKAHRMFSYFIMEELLKGEKNVKELYGKAYKNTIETTRANYGDLRLQEPTMEGNAEIGF